MPLKWCCYWYPEICSTNHPEGDMIDKSLLEDKLEIADARTNLFYDPDGPAYNMAPAVRSQADNQQDLWSDRGGLDTGDETLTRQEDAKLADINWMMERHGVDIQGRPIQWNTETDYNMDLQQAKHAVHAAKAANFNVPPELRGQYPNWLALLNGVETGAYARDLQELKDRKDAEEKAKGETPKPPKTDPS